MHGDQATNILRDRVPRRVTNKSHATTVPSSKRQKAVTDPSTSQLSSEATANVDRVVSNLLAATNTRSPASPQKSRIAASSQIHLREHARRQDVLRNLHTAHTSIDSPKLQPLDLQNLNAGHDVVSTIDTPQTAGTILLPLSNGKRTSDIMPTPSRLPPAKCTGDNVSVIHKELRNVEANRVVPNEQHTADLAQLNGESTIGKQAPPPNATSIVIASSEAANTVSSASTSSVKLQNAVTPRHFRDGSEAIRLKSASNSSAITSERSTESTGTQTDMLALEIPASVQHVLNDAIDENNRWWIEKGNKALTEQRSRLAEEHGAQLSNMVKEQESQKSAAYKNLLELVTKEKTALKRLQRANVDKLRDKKGVGPKSAKSERKQREGDCFRKWKALGKHNADLWDHVAELTQSNSELSQALAVAGSQISTMNSSNNNALSTANNGTTGSDDKMNEDDDSPDPSPALAEPARLAAPLSVEMDLDSSSTVGQPQKTAVVSHGSSPSNHSRYTKQSSNVDNSTSTPPSNLPTHQSNSAASWFRPSTATFAAPAYKTSNSPLPGPQNSPHQSHDFSSSAPTRSHAKQPLAPVTSSSNGQLVASAQTAAPVTNPLLGLTNEMDEVIFEMDAMLRKWDHTIDDGDWHNPQMEVDAGHILGCIDDMKARDDYGGFLDTSRILRETRLGVFAARCEDYIKENPQSLGSNLEDIANRVYAFEWDRIDEQDDIALNDLGCVTTTNDSAGSKVRLWTPKTLWDIELRVSNWTSIFEETLKRWKQDSRLVRRHQLKTMVIQCDYIQVWLDHESTPDDAGRLLVESAELNKFCEGLKAWLTGQRQLTHPHEFTDTLGQQFVEGYQSLWDFCQMVEDL